MFKLALEKIRPWKNIANTFKNFRKTWKTVEEGYKMERGDTPSRMVQNILYMRQQAVNICTALVNTIMWLNSNEEFNSLFV